VSSWSESKKPTPDSSDDDFRTLLRATMLEARSKLDKAILALDNNDGPAYASAVAEFKTVRQTSARWLEEM
jgi:hypothetical protein